MNKQQLIQHEHNRHKGQVGMAKSCLRSIANSPTITPETRKKVELITPLLLDLDKSLSSRVNEDGTIKTGLYTVEQYLYRGEGR